MNGRSSASGRRGEQAAIAMLEQIGWKLLDRQVPVHGHRIDACMFDPDGTEVLVQVKAWEQMSGRDTVKKDIADAWHLRYCGERRPIMLVLTERLTGTNGRMVRDALLAGLYRNVLILSITELP